MTIHIARFKNSVHTGHNATPRTLDDMKAIKQGEDCFKITEEQYDQIVSGWTATESGGVVSVVAPAGWQLEQDMKTWKEDITKTDRGMPRYLEDLITDNPTFTINEHTQTKYDAKIELRGKRP